MHIPDIIDALGGATAIASAMSLPPTTVQNWRVRQSIPARYHAEILRLSAGAVTAEQMVAAHARPVALPATRAAASPRVPHAADAA